MRLWRTVIILPSTKKIKFVIPANTGIGVHTIDSVKMIEHKRAPFPGIQAPETLEHTLISLCAGKGALSYTVPLLCVGDSIRIKELFPDELVIGNQGLPPL